MKRKILNIVLALVLTLAGLMGTGFSASASTQTTGWDVTYDGNGLSSNYDVSKSTITSVMPGDTVIFQVNYKNDSDSAAEFYLSTDIINSLEEKNADGTAASISGGAYTYKLTYTLDGKTTTLYDSKTVGGDNTAVIGLNQIQGSLDKGENTYFDVGQVSAGHQGLVEIEIQLDGNSQDNAYMQKLASLDVRFGIEKAKTVAETTVIDQSETRHVAYSVPGGTEVVVLEDEGVPLANTPQTGDSAMPLLICTGMFAVGGLLILWYFWLTKIKREKVA